MSQYNAPVFRLYQPNYRIVLSAALTAIFGLRALLAAEGSSSLSGPLWVVLNGTVAVLSLVRCFDRVTVTPAAITVTRVGRPRRLAPETVRQLVVSANKSGSWSRMHAVLLDGRQVLLAAERNNVEGQGRMRALWDHTHWLAGSRFQPYAPGA